MQTATLQSPQLNTTKKNNPADDFFSDSDGFSVDTESDMDDFVDHMSQDKEKIDIEPDPIEELDDEVDFEEKLKGERDTRRAEINEYVANASADHRMNAEMILIQLDKFMAFLASVHSGESSDKYRKRKKRPVNDEDYEADLLAGILYKYQFKLSLEGMFITAIVLAYIPVANEAERDRKVNKHKKEMMPVAPPSIPKPL